MEEINTEFKALMEKARNLGATTRFEATKCASHMATLSDVNELEEYAKNTLGD